MAEPRWTDVVTGNALRAPRAVAVHGAGPTLTYAELDAGSDRLARRLRALGAGPGSVIALLMPRTSALVTAILAVTKAGAAYFPLEVDQPPRRVATLLDQVSPAWTITDQVRDEATGGRSAIVLFGPAELAADLAAASEPGADRDLAHPADGDDLAYVIATSGSTGTPKSVLITHRGVMNMVEQQIGQFAVSATSRVLQCASIGFDAAFSEIAMALCSGARLELAAPGELTPGWELAATVARRGITHLTLTPSALSVLAPHELPSVSTLVVAGEASPPALIDRWAPGRRLINAYGPAEATVCVTLSDPLTAGPAPIGRALAGTRVEVLDENLRPLPPGEPGELWVAGPGVARGYLGSPALTARRFLADPRGEPGSRMYRTGDLGYRDAAGQLWFTGRDDGQVKIRGHRVDTAEVAAVLAAHPSVREARVLAHADARGALQLVAYVVAADPPSVRSEVALTGPLRAWVREHLPEAMVPTAVRTLPRLPLTRHGKLDTQALRAGSLERQDREPRRVSTPVGVLCDLFNDVLDLGLDGCRPDDDFFGLGGHSLTGALLLGRVRTVFGTRLTLPDLAAAATPRALARLLGRDAESAPALGIGAALALRSHGDGPPLFCLPPATGLGWAYARLLGGLHPRHPVYALQSPGLNPDDPPARSVPELVEHCVGQIRAIRPLGPYHLVGWSFGGVLAHAVAVALRQAGQPVELLAVLDGYPGAGGTRAALGPAEAPGAGELGEPEVRTLLGAGLGPEDQVLPPGLPRVLRAHVRLQRDHVPEVFDGSMTLFTAGPAERSGAGSWRPHLTGELTVVPVAAGHHTMLEPAPLRTITTVLAELLETSAPAAHSALTAPPSADPDRPDPLDTRCHVLRNDAGQYCLWPAALPVPEGWHTALIDAERGHCLSYVEQVWTDPLLRGGPDA